MGSPLSTVQHCVKKKTKNGEVERQCHFDGLEKGKCRHFGQLLDCPCTLQKGKLVPIKKGPHLHKTQNRTFLYLKGFLHLQKSRYYFMTPI